MVPMWTELMTHLDLEEPVPMGGNVYLGCEQVDFVPKDARLQERTEFVHKLLARSSKELQSLRDGNTCEDDDKKTKEEDPRAQPKSKTTKPKKVKAYYYRMTGHSEQTVERYFELGDKSKDSLKPVATPCIDDHMLDPSDFETKGILSPVAAKIVLKAVYSARTSRPDELWAVNTLAR